MILYLTLLVGAAAFQSPRTARPAVRVLRSNEVGFVPNYNYGDDWNAVEGGSFILEPTTAARGVAHFLGGAFVGAASQLTYRYLLERMRASGFVVVATPYRLSFDYLSVCDAVDESLELALQELRPRYGDALCEDVVCVGHSCGALLHTLLATRQHGPATRKRLALISFNNKMAKESIPLFEELVAPISQAVRADSEPARAAREAFGVLRNIATAALDAVDDESSPIAQLALRAPLGEELRDFAREQGLPQLARQGLELADQFPELLQEISDGAREFSPTPIEVRDRLRKSYRAPETLVLQFSEDEIDESDDLYATLRDAQRVQAKEVSEPPVIDVIIEGNATTTSTAPPPPTPMRVVKKRIEGTHLTPLTQDIFLPASTVAAFASQDADGLLASPRGRWLDTVDGAYTDLLDWLDEVAPLDLD